MANAMDTHGAVFERGSAVLMSRVVDSSGQPVQISDISTIHYSITQIDPSGAEPSQAVSGHDQASLFPTQVVYNTLQTDPIWTVDATGFNFRHEIDIASNEAFPTAGKTYQVRYDLQPVSGQRVVFRFLLKAI